MNDLTLLREAGPAAPPLRPEVAHTARGALLDEIERSRTVRGRARTRLPRPRTALRIGAGITVAAVAWTAAVVIAAPDELGPPPADVDLVAFEPLTFPLSPDPLPPAFAPTFDAEQGVPRMHYGSGNGGLTIAVSEDEPEFTDVTGEREVEVGDREAVLVTTTAHSCEVGPGGEESCALRDDVTLVDERRAGQWVTVTAWGTFDDTERLVDAAASLIDAPRRVPLQVSLAPAGWSVLGYKDDRILTLVNDAHEQQTLSVHVPLPEEVIPAGQVRKSIMGPIGPQLDVTVNDRPAQLVRVQSDYQFGDHRYERWYLQAQFVDGTTFVVQAPEAFTRQQVLQLAETVTYTP
jgi:hypothetical protein